MAGTRYRPNLHVVGSPMAWIGPNGYADRILGAGLRPSPFQMRLQPSDPRERMHGAALIWPSRPSIAPTAPPRTAGYSTLTKELEGTGQQAHHLNQNAVYRDIIPENEGLSVGLRGNAFTEVGSPHYNAHRSLEGFWNQFRRGGARFGQTPTNAEYGAALEASLRAGGLSPADAATVAAQAAQQRAAYGLAPTAPVPRIPGRINQTPPPPP
ncbi:Uncharacterized protein OS=Clostridium clariflavum (strain DSM 19732 / NBRC 101661 / EBR45) GN=Clocl_3206 PE=4 SV=1 [Tuwongella immobilis]|uniref:Uncharacterized protein n=1 Tax=Tuwongella immobilis TaxID=692036 RepID=A0A6C2YV67_9BACT|nr:Uncharacterized protein OS=Clostridium clariflavum (strain DSM 19732 / NBRC 101661 / EBR45) GN=Clocl_3206 PE=4 SV=1 [Tuwongella immobilis]VTS07938.1 Uncharacterized protein OS=Clostridium clariflavum (strain DSM 19732 / NBRC 101661 / EBR45) GN=Clocl_3206 PE=4 SV=1 [Tuwongella immobilis]